MSGQGTRPQPRPVLSLMKSTVVNLPAEACRRMYVDALDWLVVDASHIQLLLLSTGGRKKDQISMKYTIKLNFTDVPGVKGSSDNTVLLIMYADCLKSCSHHLLLIH